MDSPQQLWPGKASKLGLAYKGKTEEFPPLWTCASSHKHWTWLEVSNRILIKNINTIIYCITLLCLVYSFGHNSWFQSIGKSIWLCTRSIYKEATIKLSHCYWMKPSPIFLLFFFVISFCEGLGAPCHQGSHIDLVKNWSRESSVIWS